MFVACPQCGFLVATSSSAPRCPRCGSLVDTRTAKPYEPATDQDDAATAPAVDDGADGATQDVVDNEIGDSVAEATSTPGDDDASADEADASAEVATTPTPAAPRAPRSRTPRARHHAPSFVRLHAPAPERSSGWRWWSLVGGLGVLLVLQLALAQRETLAASARWRPAITGLCTVLRCQVPAWREPAAFTMLQRSVQPKRGNAGVLNVSASFRNDARWPQPWPTVLLTLSDMDGRQVGMRAFTPKEYSADGGEKRIEPGQSATIQFDVVEPARQVVAFTFDFH
ncbi:DUF3426 domain-containing protein [Lysobacter fragariae]